MLSRQYKHIWKLINTLLYLSWTKKKITRKIRIFQTEKRLKHKICWTMLKQMSVRLAYYNKVPQTRLFTNNKHLFLTVIKAGRPKIKVLSFCCVLQDLSGVFYVRTLTPYMRAPYSWRNHFSKVWPLNNITLGIRRISGFQQMNFWGHKHSVHNSSFS